MNDLFYIDGPDGKPLTFASDAEVDAYRRALREAEPPLLQCLRQHRNKVLTLHQRVQDALAQPHGRGRGDALYDIETGLRFLNYAMVDDITAAERDQANFSPKAEKLLKQDP